MGNAILYCGGCNLQLRESDFDRGAAFRADARAWCKACAPEEIRSQPPPAERKRMGETSPIKLTQSSTRKISTVPDPPESSSKALLYIGGGVGLLALLAIVVLMGGGGNSTPRRSAESPAPTPMVESNPVQPPPPPPTRNERPAEESLKRAREYAQVNPENLTAQLALFDTAVREAEGTGHHAAALRERDAVLAKQKAAAQKQLDALDVAVRGACDKEDFAGASRLIGDARLRPMGSEWSTELDARQRTVDESANKLFAALRNDAAEAHKRGAEEDVKRLSLRVEKWGIEMYRTDLAKAIAGATPKPKSKSTPPKEVDTYRKKWADAIAIAAGRDYPAALKKLEEAGTGHADASVKAEHAADTEMLKAVMAAQEEGVQLFLKSPKGQKSSLAYLNEAGMVVEVAGTLTRIEGGQIDLALEKGTRQIPVGEIAARSLAQTLKGKRNDRDLALLCLMEGDAEGAKTFAAPTAVPEKYWKIAPAAVPAETEARRLFYAADRELGSSVKAIDAAQKFAALLKDRADTAFVKRNRALIAARAEAQREFFFIFEDLRVGGAFKAFKGEKDEMHWKSMSDGECTVEMTFAALADTEYRCWAYVGGCCTEGLSCTVRVAEGSEPPGEAVPAKQLPSMTFKTHASHEGRGRPVLKWGWVQLPLPKFSTAGVKKVRIVSPLKGFCVSQALVSATRASAPGTTEMLQLERTRTEQRGAVKLDPSLVGWWKLNDGSGTTASDLGPFGADGKCVNGAAWSTGATPALKLDGTGYVALGPDLAMLQRVTGATLMARICPDKVGGADTDHYGVLCISRNNGATPTPESRATMSFGGGGWLSCGARATDTSKGFWVKSAEKPIKVGTWIHLASVIDYSADTITLYANGVPLTAAGTIKFEAKITPNTPSTNAAIGADDDGKTAFFRGMISDVRLYNRVLTREEIAEIAAPR